MTQKDKELLDIIDEDIQKQRIKSTPFFLLSSIPGAVVATLLLWFLINLTSHPLLGILFLTLIIFAFVGYLFLVLNLSMKYVIKNWDFTEQDKKVEEWLKKWDIPMEDDETDETR